jgi:signal transduction histidine kinase
MAVVGDRTYIPWLTLLGLIMLLTPSGHLTSRTWRVAAWMTVAGGIVTFCLDLFRPYRGPFADRGIIQNPLALPRLATALDLGGIAALIALHIGVLTGAISLVVRFRNARDAERMQLRWLGWSAVPFACFVVGAFIAATVGNDAMVALLAGGFLAIVPVSAGLAIEQYHLYDIEHLVSRGVVWTLLSALLVGCYATVALFVGESLGSLGGDSQIPAVAATLATVSILGPARRTLQAGLDRRFNRRRFDAVATIRRYLRAPAPSISIEQALRTALTDPALTVAYRIDGERWVTADGIATEPGATAIQVERHDVPICAIAVDPRRSDPHTVQMVVDEALTELENARLRAAISLQLVEVRESRARIVAAQVGERHKIERNLHDGAQQRLLAIALQLRTAELSQDPDRLHDTVAHAVDQVQLAVQELRDLANGLLPVALADGGLAAVVDDLAARTPIPVRLCVTDQRYPARVEETAWFIACEAVANAVKHAAPQLVTIRTEHEGRLLRLVIEDDGAGGADATGSGLRGIADRAEAIGGRVIVQDRAGRGTIVTAELPCAL